MENVCYVSPFNKAEEVQKQFAFSPKLDIVDCTLRDGEQQAGIAFTKEDKVNIACALDKMGIREIEVGMPAVSKEDQKATEEILACGLNARIIALARPIKEDIDMLSDMGVKYMTLSIPIGDIQRGAKLGWDDETYIKNLLYFTDYAKNKGLYVNVSPYDTTRVEVDFLRRALGELVKAGTMDRIRLVDTVGSASPAAIKYMVRLMKDMVGDIPLEVHCHDDFGMATACTIAGAEAGADFLSTTMNGIGERAGNAPTEEVMVALYCLYGIDLGFKYNEICNVSKLVEELSQVKLQQHKAIVGRHAFAHESGTVVAGVLKNSFVAEGYKPEFVGQERSFLIGKKSGSVALAEKLKTKGIVLDKPTMKNLLEDVKATSVSLKRTLTDEEFFEIVKNYSY